MERKAVITENHTKDGKQVKVKVCYTYDDSKHKTVQESIKAHLKFRKEDQKRQTEYEDQVGKLQAAINLLTKQYADWRSTVDTGYTGAEVYIDPNDIEFIE